MKFIIGIILCFSISVLSYSQTDPITQSHGATNQGLGNLKVSPVNAWSIFNNVGALSRLSKSQFSVGADHRFGLKELSTLDLAFVHKMQAATIGFSVSRFGGKLFNQQSLGFGVSNQLGIVSLGVKAEWLQTQIEGFGRSGALVISFGGVAELSPKVFFAAHVSNINRAKTSPENNNRLPTGIQLGLNYIPTEQLKMFLEIEKDIKLTPVTKLGISYSIKEWIIIRSGINTSPSRLFFGFGVLPGKFNLNYAYGQNSSLGNTHHLSLGISWD